MSLQKLGINKQHKAQTYVNLITFTVVFILEIGMFHSPWNYILHLALYIEWVMYW